MQTLASNGSSGVEWREQDRCLDIMFRQNTVHSIDWRVSPIAFRQFNIMPMYVLSILTFYLDETTKTVKVFIVNNRYGTMGKMYFSTSATVLRVRERKCVC